MWPTAEETFNFGTRLLDQLSRVPTNRQLRDVVLAALLRRALVISGSILKLLHTGLVETSVALSRSLMDIELTIQLIVQDETDDTALRLVAYDYYQRQLFGQKQLSDTATRGVLAEYPGESARVKSASRGWKEQFNSPFFDRVREDLLRDLKEHRGWHGRGTQEEAFAFVGDSPEYFRQYNLQSPFVHAVNPEADMLEEREGKPFLKPIFATEPEQILPTLALALFRLYHILVNVIADRLYAPALADAALERLRLDALRPYKAESLELGHRLRRVFTQDPLPDNASAEEKLSKE